MLDFLLIVTLLICMLSGFFVLAVGDWRKFGLKYSAVALSSASAIYLLLFHLTHATPGICSTQLLCSQYVLYGAVRNIAFTLFHFSVGRDAIRFKYMERRQTLRSI